MPPQTSVPDVLSALHQAFYGMYAILIREGHLQKGELAGVLSNGDLSHHLTAGATTWLHGMAEALDNIDRGGVPDFGVIEGGKAD